MSIPLNSLSPCTHSRISLSSLETIEQTVQAIHTLLEKEVLMSARYYRILTKPKSGSHPSRIITSAHDYCIPFAPLYKSSFLGKEFTPYSRFPSLTAEKIKEIAHHLPFCGNQSDLDADAKALLETQLTADAKAVNEKSEEKDLSFSTFSHIVLEFKKMALAKVEKFIQGETQTLFILGDTGSGKSTTFCYLKGNAMTLKDNSYQSLTPEGDLIGNDGNSLLRETQKGARDGRSLHIGPDEIFQRS
ncbi:hypothetical protein ACTFIV_005139 [Dictyostelium citrinum]